MPAINLGPFKIQLQDKLRSGFRAKYNLLVDKVIKDAQPAETGLKLITHDNTEIEVDLTEYFYDKATIDDLVFLSYATEEEAGKIRIGTIEEVFDGDDDLTVVTPYKLSLLLAQFNGRPVIAGEDLEYGDMICLVPTIEYAVPGDETSERTITEIKAYKAIATEKESLCDGYVDEGGLAGEEIFVKFSGAINPGLIDLIPHKYYYLSAEDPGKITDIAPVSGFKQVVGYAISANELMMELQDADTEFIPFIEELPEFIFTVGVESTQELLLTDFRPEGNEDIYSYRFIALPEWISDHTVIFDNISLTGLPEEEGLFRSQLEVINEAGQKYIADLIIRAIPAVKITATLIDANTGIELGLLPGGYLNPEKINILIGIEGLHDSFNIALSGGGDNGLYVQQQYAENVLETEEGEYLADPDNGGIETEVGVYKLTVTVFRNDVESGFEEISFVLYDEEYLSKASFEFWDATKEVKLADINPDGSSVFPMPDGSFDVKVIVEDNSHDQAIFSLALVGVNNYNKTYDQNSPVDDFDYFLFDQAFPDQLPGIYELELSTNLSGNSTYNRLIRFEVLKKEVKPEGGLVLTEVTINTANNTPIAHLPLKGYDANLPSNWNILSYYKGELFDCEEVLHYQKVGNALVEFRSDIYTGKPQYNLYSKPISESSFYAFRTKGSLDIDGIHKAPSYFRFIVRRRIGGLSGEIVSEQQADFSFREILSPAEYSGIRFININNGQYSLIDENMPKQGREYLYPTSPAIWSASIKSFGGKTFSRVRVYLEKYINGAWVNLHWQTPDYIYAHITTKVTSLDADNRAYIIGLGKPGSRYLYDPDGKEVLIDEPGRYRATFRAYISFIPVSIRSTDFTLTDPEEEIPIKDCCQLTSSGSGGQAGDGLSSEIVDEFTYLNVNVDNTTLEIYQPNNPTLNYLRLKQKGVTFDHIINITGRSLLGNVLAGSSSITSVDIISDLNLATNNNIPSSLATKTYIEDYVNTSLNGSVNGTSGYLPKFGTSNTLVNSILREAAGIAYVEGGLYVGTSANEKVTFASTSANSYIFFRDSSAAVRYFLDSNATRLSFLSGSTEVFRINQATQDTTFAKPINIPTSAAPLVVSSSLLVTNFNADLLDGQHGTYYLNRTNHTGTQLAATISDFSAAVRAVTLTGITFNASTVTASDSVLSAIGKLQAQISAGATGVGGTGTAGFITKWTSSSTLGNSIISESGAALTVAGSIKVNAGNGGVSQIYQEWTPADYGINNFRMYLYRTNANNLFQFVVGDGSTTGSLDFVVNNLMYNGLTIATRSWANSQFALINHTHPTATTSTAGFLSAADKAKLDGLSSGSMGGSGTIGNIAKFTATNAIGNSLLSESGAAMTVTNGSLSIKRGTSNNTQIYLELAPTDYGTGNHRLYFYRTSAGNLFQVVVGDGSTSGNLDFVTSSLTWNSAQIATQSYVSSNFAVINHTHTASQITNFTVAVRASLSAGSGISYDSSTGIISATGGGGTLTGSGQANYFAIWTGSSVLGISTITDNGSEINFNNQRTFGVEGGGAFRSFLHVHNYFSVGKATQHGSIVVHNQTNAVPDSVCAIQVLSTTRGIGFPVMTRAQRLAIASPIPGLVVYQSDSSGSSIAGLKLYLFNQWVHQSWSLADA